ncbi:MAG: hypothetical protein QSU88_12625, partial [Candidatus Methanoperedens sp.]|nr:hypothetical protein [Candidatus Methanoperedens sp.]
MIDSNISSFPIEPLGYTQSEFEIMLGSYRITALDAISEGIPLLDAEYFNSLKDKLNKLEKMGLYKGKKSWHIPVA